MSITKGRILGYVLTIAAISMSLFPEYFRYNISLTDILICIVGGAICHSIAEVVEKCPPSQ